MDACPQLCRGGGGGGASVCSSGAPTAPAKQGSMGDSSLFTGHPRGGAAGNGLWGPPPCKSQSSPSPTPHLATADGAVGEAQAHNLGVLWELDFVEDNQRAVDGGYRFVGCGPAAAATGGPRWCQQTTKHTPQWVAAAGRPASFTGRCLVWGAKFLLAARAARHEGPGCRAAAANTPRQGGAGEGGRRERTMQDVQMRGWAL